MKQIVFMALAAALMVACTQKTNNQNEDKMKQVEMTQEWDKVFPKSDKVDHRKVTFTNQYGITLVADMYVPKKDPLAEEGESDSIVKFPAIAVRDTVIHANDRIIEWPVCHANGRTWFRDYCL